MAKRRQSRYPLDPMAMFRPMSEEKRAKHALINLTALETIAKAADPDKDAWNSLADACNVVEALIDMGEIDKDHAATLNPAVAAMKAAAKRHHAGQRMGMTGEELQAMRALCDLYEICLERKTHMTIHRATLRADKEARKAWQSGRVARGEAVTV